MPGSTSDQQSTVHSSTTSNRSALGRDLTAGLVVFLVALPLCLGIALASGAPLFSGIVSGIVGGLIVGFVGGSHTSVSGPAAGLTAIVLAQLAALGSFEALLLAVLIAGVMQIGLGLARAGALATFVPTSVIKGLLAAIGVILVLKQFPHVLGHDTDPEGEMAFEQPDHENTFSELLAIAGDLHVGAAVIGLLSIALLVAWSRVKLLQGSRFPAPLAVVLLGLGLGQLFLGFGGDWAIGEAHLVQVPVAKDLAGLVGLLRFPDLSQWQNPGIYTAAVTIAIVASLETLLNLEAVDRIDPEQRVSPPNRELVAQGVGNITCGLVGGLPITSVIIRGSVNIYSGAATKRSTIFHGALLLVPVVALPGLLNRIPLSCLAAILLVTGFRLASPALIRKMWADGPVQFVPFAATVLGIVFTDLLIGLLIGMGVSLGFILRRHARKPVRRIFERHLGGDVLHIELPEQVSFLNQTALERALMEAPRGGHVHLDARRTDYIDPDVLALIREYRDVTAPARGVQLSMTGFHEDYALRDEVQYVDYSAREQYERAAPAQVLEILRLGNARFASGQRINRDLVRQVNATADGQRPLAVVLSCIDSRTPVELVFDLGLGDVFSVRIAGNVLSPRVLGSIEYGCAVGGARLVVVMGHTRCGAVTAAVEQAQNGGSARELTGCQHLGSILADLRRSIDADADAEAPKEALIDAVARRNVSVVVERIVAESETVRRLLEAGNIAVIGALYDVTTGNMEFIEDEALGLTARERAAS